MLLAGCAISVTPVDAGRDAPLPSVDTGLDTNAPDTHCELAPVPAAIPPFTADFQLNDSAVGTVVPTMTGGDPIGTWLFDHGTFWVDAPSNAMFNRFASSVTGSAWIAIDATTFRLAYVFIAHLEGTEAGAAVRETITRAFARWRLDHEQIEPTGLVCSESSEPAFADPGRVTFTRTGDHLTMLIEAPMETGLTILQLEGTLAP
jgi:hypothetical protein